MLSADGADAAPGDARFLDAFRIPLVRAVMPAAGAVALGLGALFSLGIVFVREVLGASDTEFGGLIALFGVGAAFGLLVLQLRRGRDPLSETRLGVVAIGLIVAAFSLAGSVWLAYIGAVAFGAAAAYSLSSGMGALQARLDGHQRILAFAAFHVVIRIGLSLAAIGAGLAGDLLESVRWPWIGELEPSRVVLLCSGIIVVMSAALVSRARVLGGAHDVTDRGTSRVAVVTDSAAALPADLAARHGITVVPMWLTVARGAGARRSATAARARRRRRGHDVSTDAGRVRARHQGRVAGPTTASWCSPSRPR